MGLLSDAQAQLRRIREAGHREIIVSFSGGKDSWAVLDLCHREFPRVHAFFLYIVKGLECEEKTLRRAEARYGIEIHRLPSPALGRMLATGYFLPRPIPFRRQLRQADLFRIVRERIGNREAFVAAGHRMDESLQRRAMIKRHEGIDWRLRKCWPLWNWNARGVYAYLRGQKIEFPETFGSWDTGGLSLGTESLRWLKEHSPGDFAKVTALFPFAAVKLERERLRNESGMAPSQIAK